MPPVVAAAAITGLASVGGGVLASRAQSGANRRALEASERGAQRAEAFEREQDQLNRSDDARREAEDRRRFDIDQANIVAQQRERDERQRYEDMLRYRRMVNIAQLTGQAPPPPPPMLSGGSTQPPQTMPLRNLARPPIAFSESRPGTRTQSLIENSVDPLFNPLAEQRMPLSRLSGTR